MVDWQLRVRAFLSTQFTTLVVVLVVLALLGGWMTYTAHANPETTTEQRSVVQWEQTGEFDHSATVTEPNSVFQTGTTLDDRSVYFARLSPQLDGTFQTAYDAREHGELDQTVSVAVVMRAVDSGDSGVDETVYWERREQIAESTERAVEPGEPLSVGFSQDMTAVESQLTQIRDEVGSSPGETEVRIRATVSSEGTVNGERVNETNTYSLSVGIDGDTYTVTSNEPTVEQYETTQTERSSEAASGLRATGGPLLFLGAIGLLLGVGKVGPREQLSEAERTVIAYEDDRETFDDWISEIELPADAFDLPEASATSLGELVDFAIDTNNSVIEDPTTNAYHVRHDGYLYTYQPPNNADTEPAAPESEAPATQADDSTDATDTKSGDTE